MGLPCCARPAAAPSLLPLLGALRWAPSSVIFAWRIATIITAASSGHSPISLRRRHPERPRRPIALRASSARGLATSLPPPLPRAAPPRAASAFPVLSSSAICSRSGTAAAFGAASSSNFADLRTLPSSAIGARLAATAFAAASLGVLRAIQRFI